MNWYVADGRLAIDNNAAERLMKPVSDRAEDLAFCWERRSRGARSGADVAGG
jgi:hypothetical protein